MRWKDRCFASRQRRWHGSNVKTHSHRQFAWSAVVSGNNEELAWSPGRLEREQFESGREPQSVIPPIHTEDVECGRELRQSKANEHAPLPPLGTELVAPAADPAQSTALFKCAVPSPRSPSRAVKSLRHNTSCGHCTRQAAALLAPRSLSLARSPLPFIRVGSHCV